MSEIQWTDQAVDAALDQWLPGQHADHQVPALRGAMIDALNAGFPDVAVTVWDKVSDEHAAVDADRDGVPDQAPYFAVEPNRRDTARLAAMRAAIDAAHDTQAKTGGPA